MTLPFDFDTIEQMTRTWSELVAKMAANGAAGASSSDSAPQAARHVRNAMFGAMASAADEFMRSPQYLDLMKQSMDASITFRKQLNDWLAEAHHSTQGVARQDVDSVLVTLRRSERRILDRLEDLGKRIEALEQCAASHFSAAAGATDGAGQPGAHHE